MSEVIVVNLDGSLRTTNTPIEEAERLMDTHQLTPNGWLVPKEGLLKVDTLENVELRCRISALQSTIDGLEREKAELENAAVGHERECLLHEAIGRVDCTCNDQRKLKRFEAVLNAARNSAERTRLEEENKRLEPTP